MFPNLIADTNISVTVLNYMRGMGIDIISASESNSGYSNDLISDACSTERFIITHDSDFWHSAISRREPVRMIYLHADRRGTDELFADIDFLIKADIDWSSPKIALYRQGKLRIRQIAGPAAN
jgi:predicted nuclease of predicted toxin-antitoxin system